jgi:hypothetical protein
MFKKEQRKLSLSSQHAGPKWGELRGEQEITTDLKDKIAILKARP